MTEATTYFYQWFRGYTNLAFNSFMIATNVSIGWICITCIIFGILLNSILNIPRVIPHVTESESTTKSESRTYDKNRNLKSIRRGSSKTNSKSRRR